MFDGVESIVGFEGIDVLEVFVFEMDVEDGVGGGLVGLFCVGEGFGGLGGGGEGVDVG